MTRTAAVARLEEAARYLDQTLRSMPIPAVGSPDLSYAQEAKRKAAWRGYFAAQAAVRKATRTALDDVK